VAGGGVFMSQVDAAETKYKLAHINLFDSKECFLSPGVNGKNWNDYYAGVVQNVNSSGLHAIVDAGGEIAVKSDNTFSEQYHVLTSSGCIHRAPGMYRSTCTPAWF
jgi:hypothetical protein